MTTLKMGIENPKSLSTIHTLAFFLSTTGAASIPFRVLQAAGEKIIDRTPKRCQEFSHLKLIVGSGLANEDLGTFADSQGIVGGFNKNFARISRKKLLARGFRLKNETFFFFFLS